MRKDSVITVRVPRPTRRRLETLARKEGRSLSQQVERLLERGLDAAAAAEKPDAALRLSGLLAGEPIAEYGDFRSIRTLLSASLQQRVRRRGSLRR